MTGIVRAGITNAELRDADVAVTLDGEIVGVSATALPLPAGAATETTLGSLLTQFLLAVAKLNDIFGAVDGLEITAGNIDISNTSIGLSVDTLEALLQQIRDNAITEDFAQDATMQAILTELQQKLEALPTDFPDAAVLAKLEVIRGLVAGTLTVQGTVEITNDVGNPIPVSGTAKVGLFPPNTNAVLVTAMSGDDITQIECYSDTVGGTLIATINLAYSTPGVLLSAAVVY